MTTSQTTDATSEDLVKEVNDTVRGLLAAELDLDLEEIAEITADAVLRELPGADSLHLLRVVAGLERHYGLEFEDEKVFGVTTLAEVMDLIITELSGSS